MDKYLICFLLTFFLSNICALTEWSNWPFSYPCQEGLCVPRDRYKCPCWHYQYHCKPNNRFSCCEDPSFFPMPGDDKFVCQNQTKTVAPPIGIIKTNPTTPKKGINQPIFVWKSLAVFLWQETKGFEVISTCSAYLHAVVGNYLAIWLGMSGLISVIREQKKVPSSPDMQTKHNDTDFHFH